MKNSVSHGRTSLRWTLTPLITDTHFALSFAYCCLLSTSFSWISLSTSSNHLCCGLPILLLLFGLLSKSWLLLQAPFFCYFQGTVKYICTYIRIISNRNYTNCETQRRKEKMKNTVGKVTYSNCIVVQLSLVNLLLLCYVTSFKFVVCQTLLAYFMFKWPCIVISFL